MCNTITAEQISGFMQQMRENERAEQMVRKYGREAELFAAYVGQRALTKELVLAYRAALTERCCAQTVNGKVSAVNALLAHAGMTDCRVKLLRVQRQSFLREDRELRREDYTQLLETAKRHGQRRLYYIIMTLCSTGIRVSELRFITAEAVRDGHAEIRSKGKSRTVILPKKLCRALRSYARQQGVTQGHIFRTRNGNVPDRSNICHELKRLSEWTDVDKSKVFPHNFRHLFARSFYAVKRNIAYLADVLGHSSVETTRIYVATSLREHEQTIERLNLVQ